MHALIFANPVLFLSTLSLRRATVTVLGIQHRVGISIHALLAESDERSQGKRGQIQISIHALLAESDINGLRHKWASFYFYPRSPCGERQLISSTYSLYFDFYPRSPCGERPHHALVFRFFAVISIHALLAESDPYNWSHQNP